MPAITCALACSSASLLRSEDSSACAACSSWWIALSRSFCWRALSSKARRLSKEIEPWRSRSLSMSSFGVGAARPWRTELTELTGGGIVPGTSGPPMAVKVACGSGGAAQAAGRGVASGVATGVTIGVGCSGRGAARTDGTGAGNVVESGSPRHICGVGDTLAEEGEGTLVNTRCSRARRAHMVSHGRPGLGAAAARLSRGQGVLTRQGRSSAGPASSSSSPLRWSYTAY